MKAVPFRMGNQFLAGRPRPLSFRRDLDQRRKTLRLRLVLLRAHDMEDHEPLVRRRLGGEEGPRLSVRPEQLLLRRRQRRRLALLVGVDARLVVRATLECDAPRGRHQPLPEQDRHARNVDAAPDAPRAARREADGVARFVQAAADTIDPAVTKSLVHRLGPGHARLAGILLVETDQQFIGRPMVLREPRAEQGRRREELRLYRNHASGMSASRLPSGP